jgi:hypothetical protein
MMHFIMSFGLQNVQLFFILCKSKTFGAIALVVSGLSERIHLCVDDNPECLHAGQLVCQRLRPRRKARVRNINLLSNRSGALRVDV